MKLVQGFGINDATYSVDVKGELPRIDGKRRRYQIFLCPFYSTWREMIRRCYGKSFPSYVNVRVCDEWRSFMSFREWMTSQDYIGKHLDKDIIGCGDLYSPSTCLFLSQRINKFVVNESAFAGVYSNESSFVAKGKDLNGKSIHLGSFCDWNSARDAYNTHKLSQISHYRKIDEIDDKIESALVKRYKAGA